MDNCLFVPPRSEFREEFNNLFLKTTDVAICHQMTKLTTSYFYAFSKIELYSQMKKWRAMAKQGELKINTKNNQTKTDINGKEWHIFVLQTFNPETGEMEDNSLDIFGLHILGIFVSGIIVAFTNEKNRNAVYQYVMKDIKE